MLLTPMLDCVKILTLTPNRDVYLDHTIRRLAKGYAAELNILDKDLKVLFTMIDGKVHQDKWSQLNRN